MEIDGTNSQLSAGLRVWLSQKGIQREKPVSKYKLQLVFFIIIITDFIFLIFSRQRSEGKVKSGSW